jgi:hypothetical protein
MKLYVERDQADVRGVFGGHKGVSFSLAARLALTDEEAALISRYKQNPLIAMLQANGRPAAVVVLADLVRGWSVTVADVTELLAVENRIKRGCSELKLLLEVMETFGGEEVFEITSDRAIAAADE